MNDLARSFIKDENISLFKKADSLIYKNNISLNKDYRNIHKTFI